jgi:hypothetical protein
LEEPCRFNKRLLQRSRHGDNQSWRIKII